MKIIDLLNKIILKKCKHKKISIGYEPVSEHTHYEHQHCIKCGKYRKIIESCGTKVEGDWI